MPVRPKLRDILKKLYSTDAADKWKDIGIMLNMNIHDLNEIKSAPGNQNPQSCLREMFILYLERSNPSPPSWNATVEALEIVGEGTLAARIKSKYCSNQSE